MNQFEMFWEKGNWIGDEGQRILNEIVEAKTSLELLFPTCDKMQEYKDR